MADYFPWNKNLETSIPEIDKQHKKLVDLINQLYKAFNDNMAKKVLGSILEELIHYTVVHFTYEEKLLAGINTIDLKEHLKQHKAFTDKVLEFKQKFEKGHPITFRVMTFLRDWLTDHIQVTDKQYVNSVKNSIQN
jgi:hemerythrin